MASGSENALEHPDIAAPTLSMQSFLFATAQRQADAQELQDKQQARSLPPMVVVTTGNDRDPTATARSELLVAKLNAHGGVRAYWTSRFHTASRPMTLSKLMAQHSAVAALVVDSSGTHLRTVGGDEFRLHGGIGVLRVRTVLSGGSDALVHACMLRDGDVFVDGTAGQCQDALVAAAAVGPTGRVIALEASPLLWAVTSARPCSVGHADTERLLNERIEVRLGEAATLLAAMPEDSADVVYFDPMFATPAKSSASFEILRTFAHHEPLSPNTLVHARRVARRCVVVMDQPGGCELERLGLNVVSEGQRKRFGVLLSHPSH